MKLLSKDERNLLAHYLAEAGECEVRIAEHERWRKPASAAYWERKRSIWLRRADALRQPELLAAP